MNHFSELPLSSQVEKNLSRNGFKTPTPVQAQSIPPALAGKDLVATAQTGTGKTLAFALPIVERLLADTSGAKSNKNVGKNARALILSPTRELAIQIHETFLKIAAGTSLRAAIVVGGVSETNQLRQIREGAQVIIATPGRLEDFLQRKLVKLSGIEIYVLDEADRMLDMGFLPAIKRIGAALPADRQTMLFSATIEKSVAHLIAQQVNHPVRVEIGSISRPADLVDLHLYHVEKARKQAMLEHLLERDSGSFLVFARTKHGTDRLARKLSAAGFKAARIHGGRTQGQRNQALAGFKNGDYRILVATDVAARGIHVDGIAHVVNFDLPAVPEDFVHRIGRTGRAGAKGTASSFCMPDERSDIKHIERVLRVPLERREVPAGLEERQPDTSSDRTPARDNEHRTRRARPKSGERSPQKGKQPRKKSGREKTTAQTTPQDRRTPGSKTAKQLAQDDLARQADTGKRNRERRRRYSTEAEADRLSDMWTMGEAQGGERESRSGRNSGSGKKRSGQGGAFRGKTSNPNSGRRGPRKRSASRS